MFWAIQHARKKKRVQNSLHFLGLSPGIPLERAYSAHHPLPPQTLQLHNGFLQNRQHNKIAGHKLQHCILKITTSFFSWYNKSCWLPVKKCWCQKNLRGVSHGSYVFCIFRWSITMSSFFIVRYVLQILWREGFLLPPLPHLWAAPKLPILNRVNEKLHSCVV